MTSARAAGVRNYAWIVLVHLAFIAAWWLFVVVGKIPKFIMPTPLQTLQTLFMPHYDWLGNSIATGEEIFLGYILAVIFGVALAVVCTWSRVLSTIFMPLLVSLNMIPKVALGPLFIVWFKYGVIPNGIIAFTICFFPILLTAARGLHEVEPELLDLVRSLHGSRWQLFTKIQLPGSLPYIFSGMKVGAVLAATIVAVAGVLAGPALACLPEDQHCQLGQVVAGQHVHRTAVQHLARRACPVAPVAGAVRDPKWLDAGQADRLPPPGRPAPSPSPACASQPAGISIRAAPVTQTSPSDPRVSVSSSETSARSSVSRATALTTPVTLSVSPATAKRRTRKPSSSRRPSAPAHSVQ